MVKGLKGLGAPAGSIGPQVKQDILMGFLICDLFFHFVKKSSLLIFMRIPPKLRSPTNDGNCFSLFSHSSGLETLQNYSFPKVTWERL